MIIGFIFLKTKKIKKLKNIYFLKIEKYKPGVKNRKVKKLETEIIIRFLIYFNVRLFYIKWVTWDYLVQFYLIKIASKEQYTMGNLQMDSYFRLLGRKKRHEILFIGSC